MKMQWKYHPKILFYNLRNNNNKQNAKQTNQENENAMKVSPKNYSLQFKK